VARVVRPLRVIELRAGAHRVIGRKLSHFRILAKIGEGGMGIVYRAEDENLRRPVALKLLPQALVANAERRLRFLREARTAAAVSHPNIAAIYEIGEQDGFVFIVMELIEGETLRSRLVGRPLPIDAVLRLGAEVADGLAAAHAAHVVHRDLKPENVIIGRDGRARILDFGLAKTLRDESEEPGPASRAPTLSAQMTRAGGVLGTPSYMSPEQARGEPVDARSDIFSFGIMLYEMSAGRSPFEGRTDADILSAILRDDPPPITRFNAATPPGLRRVISTCLEKNPRNRYQRSERLADDLKGLQRSSDAGRGPRVLARLPGRHPRAVFAILATTLLALALAAFGTWRRFGSQAAFHPGDAVIVGDFENATDRRVFDTAVRDDFENLLSQSSLLAVVRGDSLTALVNRRLGETARRIDEAGARRVCGGGDCSVFVLGRIAPEASGFRLEVTLSRPEERKPVLAATTLARSEDDVLEAVYRLSLAVRRGVGEAPGALASAFPPTTRSLRAYQAYAAGQALNEWDQVGKRSLDKRALEIDPDFVEAYQDVAVVASNLGRQSEARDYAHEVFRRSSRLQEGARLKSEAFALDFTYDYDGELDRLKSYRRLFAFDQDPVNWLGTLYWWRLEDPESAASELRTSYQLTPQSENGLEMLARCLADLGKAEEIAALDVDYRKRTGRPAAPPGLRLYAAMARRDWASALEVLDRLVREGTSPEMELPSYVRLEALLALGRLREASDAASLAWMEGTKRNWRSMPPLYVAIERTWLDARRGDPVRPLPPEALSDAEGRISALKDLDVFSLESMRLEPLERILSVHETRERGTTSGFAREQLQCAHAAVALVRGEAEQARRLLEPIGLDSRLPHRHHLLARTYEALGRWDDAAGQYEAVLNTPFRTASWNRLLNNAIWILDESRLAALYDRLGRPAEARRWYERFVGDWKSADADIPELIEARRRLVALRGGPSQESGSTAP
jgi:tetratricopeptide (TPR) repeat protein